ncbi:hypothetical protein [Clostridium mediterraneense]|uniref:hypothetical protein n=1 Tax=Clostridium mediterraneense TaxID=1805472 RepID=UPI00082AFE4F|nr:hypothetical protein [Clostridium mediterraneense]
MLVKESILNEITLFESNFEKNKEDIYLKLRRVFRIIVGRKVKSIEIEQSLMKCWMYYYVNLSENDKGLGDKIILSLITDFDQGVKRDESIEFNAGTKGINIVTDFSNTWIRKNIIDMIEYREGIVQKAEEYLEVIDKEYLSKTKEVINFEI